MAKLHALLAATPSLKTQADKTRTDLMATFKHKPHHFSEKRVTYVPFKEGEEPVVESQLDLQTTVPGELQWIAPFLVRSLDAAYNVEEANMIARADVIMDDATFIAGVPATALLELEKRMKELQDFVTSIPTLDPASGFRPDPDKGPYVFKARDETKVRTKKIAKPLELSPATKEHPAQVQLVTEDTAIGKIVTLEWSGLITTAAKGLMLERVEQLARAIKQALSAANSMELPKNGLKIGDTIINFVFGL